MDGAPTIFYAPHPDADAIAMAGTNAASRTAGDVAYPVLPTDGYNEKVLDILNGKLHCTAHDTYHDFDLTMKHLMWTRKLEFLASARRLDVHQVYLIIDAALTPAGIGPALVLSGAVDSAAFTLYAERILAPRLRPG
jgi:LmbE family N-acetylglucosaminyl deacetylase